MKSKGGSPTFSLARTRHHRPLLHTRSSRVRKSFGTIDRVTRPSKRAPDGAASVGVGERWPSPPAVHLENLSPTDTWLNNDGSYTVDGTAHIDLFNPDNADVEGVGGHVGVDGLIGHLDQVFGGNIDPSHCPW